jgi:hypothetical protein
MTQTIWLLAGSVAWAAEFDPVSLESPTATIRLSVTGSWRGDVLSSRSPSVPVYDSFSQRLLIPSEVRKVIDVLDVSDPTNPTKVDEIDMRPYGGEPSSIAIRHGVVVIVVQDETGATTDSQLLFLTVQGQVLIDPITLNSASRVEFTPNGKQLK